MMIRVKKLILLLSAKSNEFQYYEMKSNQTSGSEQKVKILLVERLMISGSEGKTSIECKIADGTIGHNLKIFRLNVLSHSHLLKITMLIQSVICRFSHLPKRFVLVVSSQK